MINAYFVTEINAQDGLVFGTNHGSDPFEGNVAIQISHIVMATTRYVGVRNVQHRGGLGYGFSNERLIDATDETWICDFTLDNGDHAWFYDATFDAANDAFDAWYSAVTP